MIRSYHLESDFCHGTIHKQRKHEKETRIRCKQLHEHSMTSRCFNVTVSKFVTLMALTNKLTTRALDLSHLTSIQLRIVYRIVYS